MLRSLIHLDLSFVQGDKYKSNCVFLHADCQLDQRHFLKSLSFFHYFWQLCSRSSVHRCLGLFLAIWFYFIDQNKIKTKIKQQKTEEENNNIMFRNFHLPQCTAWKVLTLFCTYMTLFFGFYGLECRFQISLWEDTNMILVATSIRIITRIKQIKLLYRKLRGEKSMIAN